MLRAIYKSEPKHISVSEIAEQEDITYPFARNIQHTLTKSGLVKAKRGSHGGIMLNCDPEKITLLELLETMNQNISISICTKDLEYCEKSKGCGFHSVWLAADKLLEDYFASIKLIDVLKSEEG
jgi:Rrf2 family protein